MLPPSFTVWDKIDDQVLTFQYANTAEYPVLLNSIELSGAPSERLLNTWASSSSQPTRR